MVGRFFLSASLCIFAFLRVPSRKNTSTSSIPSPATPPITPPIISPLDLLDRPRLSILGPALAEGVAVELVDRSKADSIGAGVGFPVTAACMEGEMACHEMVGVTTP